MAARGGFRPDIQGLRGLAVLLVVGFHTRSVIPGGFVGVDVFFVVSGFVITGMLVSTAAKGSAIRLRDFMARRVQRLLPMLAITLTGTAALGVLLLSPLDASATTSGTAIAAALLNANTYLALQPHDYFALPEDANALLHTWSLSVEEQFYLVFPAALLMGGALLRRRRLGVPGRDPTATRWMLAGIVAAALASFALYSALMAGAGRGVTDALDVSSPRTAGFYGSPMRAWEFLVGAGLALVAPSAGRLPRAVRSGAGLVGMLLVLASAAAFSDASGFSAPLMTVPVLGTALLLVGGAGGPSTVGSLLSHKLPVWIGDRSYGWYLFHWPLIVFAAANSEATWAPFLAAAAALALAAAAKGPIEDRFRRSRRWTGRRAAALAAICTAVPVAVGVAALRADEVLRVEGLEQASRLHADYHQGCNRRHSDVVPLDSDLCTWSVEDPRGRIVLIGDSHAAMWTEAVTEAGNRAGFDVTVATMSGCPMLSGASRLRDGLPDTACARFVRSSVEEIEAMQPDLVLIGTATIGALRGGTQTWREPGGGWSSDGEDVAEIWRRGMRRTVGRLADAGVRTALLRDIPYHDLTTQTCGRVRYLLFPQSCASTVTRASFDEQRSRAVGLEDEVVAVHPLATTVEVADLLCGPEGCSTYANGTWMYRDRDHLSVAGSQALAGRVEQLLRSALGTG